MVSVAKHLESHDAALWWSWASELGHFYVIFPHSPCYLTDLVCLSVFLSVWTSSCICPCCDRQHICHPVNFCHCITRIYDLQLFMHSQGFFFAIILSVWEAEVTATVSYHSLAGL